MFLSKRPNGVSHLFYTGADGKRLSISTKTKLKSEANKFLIRFSKKLTGESDRKILPITIENFTNEFLKHSETDLPQIKDRLKE